MMPTYEPEATWPKSGLETVRNCPVCGGTKAVVLYHGMKDTVFFTAPGEWDLYKCGDCGCAYLDPRPTPESIHRAYQGYYTHGDADPEVTQSGSYLRRVIGNGYRNFRYGTRERPSSFWGIPICYMLPASRKRIDAGMRNIPRPVRGDRLLDFGCGNGEFLLKAQAAGWDAVGVDFDPKAVAAARKGGLSAFQGGIDALDSTAHQFRVITLSHVIEHVHDPAVVLKRCHDLLVPGGMLWLETPNLESLGHYYYGRHWRGLEPPRHLTLFTRKSLALCLARAGFGRIRDLPYVPICLHRFRASKAISEGESPYDYDVGRLTPADRDRIRKSDRAAARDPALRESITIMARKGA